MKTTLVRVYVTRADIMAVSNRDRRAALLDQYDRALAENRQERHRGASDAAIVRREAERVRWRVSAMYAETPEMLLARRRVHDPKCV